MTTASKIYIVILITLAFVWSLMCVEYKNDDRRFFTREEEQYHLVEAEVTAYTSDIGETDDTPNLMADGTNTRAGAIACPSKYSFGTRVVIEDDEYFCADRMNKRYRDSEHYDVWVSSKSEAFKWGRRTLTIKILHNNNGR